MNLLRKCEHLYAWRFILKQRLQKKTITNHRKGLILADMGIGDWLMFMPVVKVLFKHGYDLTFKCERAEIIEIIKGIYPQSRFISPYRKKFIGYSKAMKYYKFHFCICNFHQCYKWNIKTILRSKSPMTVGHSWPENKFKHFWTHPVFFNKTKYEPEENLNLLKPFRLYQKEKMFFITQKIKLPFASYILIQSITHTQPGKNCWNPIPFIQKTEGMENFVLIGSIEEKKQSDKIIDLLLDKNIINLCGQLNIFQTAFLIKNAKEFHCNEGGLQHIAHCIALNKVNVYYDFEYINKNKINFHFSNPKIKYIEC